MFSNMYQGRRVLVTGHTGFKGSWLVTWLHRLGADVTGLSLDPWASPSHWEVLGLDIPDHRADIRDVTKTLQIVREASPEIIFHLAAQPLVRRSYRDPLETWSTNVLGTANLLNVCRDVGSVQAVVAVTTDKVYANREWHWGYRETDELGGYDPYSASKACCELVADSYRRSFFSQENRPLLATARAGNVIGGGDWSEDRLIPDLVRASMSGIDLEIRSPQATRPWQHVLECLCGYLIVGQRLLMQDIEVATAWNFGPDRSGNRPVLEILTSLQAHWPDVSWTVIRESQPHEAGLLYLDSSKAVRELDWKPVWTLGDAVGYTAEWYQAFYSAQNVLTTSQIESYEHDARLKSCDWAGE